MTKLWALAFLGLVAAPGARVQEMPDWNKEAVALFSTLPIQDGGRVKPMRTFAEYALLQVNGRRKCATAPAALPWPLGRMIYPNRKPTEWLLDSLFFPERVGEYPMFLVEDSDAVAALGAAALGEKRGRYTYESLAPARARLLDLASMYAGKSEREFDTAQRQILHLAENLRAFERIVDVMAFAHGVFSIPPDTALAAIFDGRTPLRLSEVLGRAPHVHQRFAAIRNGEGDYDDDARARELDAFRALFDHLDEIRNGATAIALFPPSDDGASWLTVSDVVEAAFMPERDVTQAIAWLDRLEALAAARDDGEAFNAILRALHASIRARAEARGEYGRVELEAAFLNAKLFYRSLMLYIACFVLIALSWLMPRSRAMNVATAVALAVPTTLLVAGIAIRCVIRMRPPVTTLYETILFVTAVAVGIAFFIEWVNRQRVALAVGGLIGLFGMLLANKFELSHGKDTMPTMVAVLDTNFWLTAHVTTIVVGYGASLLAGAFAHIYVLARAVGIRSDRPEFYRSLTRMTYGVFCFGFLFTFAGTVLGGIWANESWGRFWGWDPKENGALLIVLWQLATLHARLGGYLREFGLHVAAVCCMAIVAFSWWGVNLLGVGLHNYGWTSGTMNALIVFWAFEGIVLAIAAATWIRGRAMAARGV
ncbi:MAG TPA: cytochrome c biogenesis protein CcsA [Candidatus Hydrogenedentes bacterium]|nr:cytochrome c biogenesis protein CcsA [Candidatus Hydrogenedentota bacterium]HPG69744.1 cytochrome c biogenesis protein CcsA [Candidatus Hydrogenedentota bacterium]